MRIVGGKFKGLLFNPGKIFKARPTTDIAKEGLFNILSNRYEMGALKVLDLFSGTGSISYEFASRGCTAITAIELNYRHYTFIRQTINHLNISGIRVRKYDVFRFLEKDNRQYNIIFADPPYDLKKLDHLPDTVFSKQRLLPDGLFILEHPKRHDFSKHDNFSELRKYGKVHFSFFKNRSL